MPIRITPSHNRLTTILKWLVHGRNFAEKLKRKVNLATTSSALAVKKVILVTRTENKLLMSNGCNSVSCLLNQAKFLYWTVELLLAGAARLVTRLLQFYYRGYTMTLVYVLYQEIAWGTTVLQTLLLLHSKAFILYFWYRGRILTIVFKCLSGKDEVYICHWLYVHCPYWHVQLHVSQCTPFIFR